MTLFLSKGIEPEGRRIAYPLTISSIKQLLYMYIDIVYICVCMYILTLFYINIEVTNRKLVHFVHVLRFRFSREQNNTLVHVKEIQ